jgi:hypothetical protein
MYVIQHPFICRPSDTTVSEDAGIEPRICCDFGIDSQTLYLTTWLDLIHTWLDLIHTWLDLIHTWLDLPHLAKFRKVDSDIGLRSTLAKSCPW